MAHFSKMLVDSAAASVLKPAAGPIPTHNRDLTSKPPEHREVRADKGVNYMARVRVGRTEWFIVEESQSVTTEVVSPADEPDKAEATDTGEPDKAEATDTGASADGTKEPTAAKRKTVAKATA